MSGTTATHLVFFVAVLAVSSAVGITVIGQTHVVSDAIEEYGSTYVEEVETQIAVVSDPESPGAIYDSRDASDDVTILVKNVGTRSIPLEGSSVDIVVNGEYVPDPTVESASSESTTNWQPDSTARITFDRELESGTHRILVGVASNEDALEFEVPNPGEPDAVSYEADPANETVDEGETITYTVTVEDGYGDPVSEGFEVEADATDGFDVEINDDGAVTTEMTDSDGRVTFEVTSDTPQDDVDVVFTEQMHGNSETGQATWDGEQEEGSLSGTVTTGTEDGDDDDLEGETVTIENSPERTTTIEADGSYDFDSVEGGEYTLWIDADGHRYYETTVIVDGPTTKDVSLPGNVENVETGASYTSLGTGAFALEDGETLELAEAVYDESDGGSSAVTVTNSDVTIRALGARDGTVLDAAGAETGLSIEGEDVSVDGLTVKNVAPSGTGVHLASARGSSLANLEVDDAGIGVDVDASNEVAIEDLEASGNDDAGVRVGDSDEVELEYVHLSGNGDGIRVTEGGQFTVTYATVTDSDGDGLNVSDSDGLTVRSSSFLRNEDNGVYIRDSNRVTVENSEMRESGRDGVLVQADESDISLDEGHFQVSSNNIEDNDGYGMWAEDGDTPVDNDELGDGTIDLEAGKLGAGSNWWGHEDGPQAEGANGVSEETVEFEPYATDRIQQAGS
ncbi:right-handed parallel beta-helix repeat-containing protein [Natrarchaeobius chitinivorans]|uniref:Right handed beta helix domain-containing protein n=1 Tax=Natrarchaeobius chitinivorans TaxID=1679083 RepID=A0A3N6M3I8_NATCH|nr:right-handed parallel beta-helix repeat-containing protein [Natrarchaeobius chitinivorans]RQG96477.1 hypothetical protein EA473_04990 [Natrarchaeobius chitinivorans]